MTDKRMTDKYEDAIEEICALLDLNVYLPVKEELEGCGRTYSLGIRKERYKEHIEKVINKLKEGSK